jgi:hypothetical protein
MEMGLQNKIERGIGEEGGLRLGGVLIRSFSKGRLGLLYMADGWLTRKGRVKLA